MDSFKTAHACARMTTNGEQPEWDHGGNDRGKEMVKSEKNQSGEERTRRPHKLSRYLFNVFLHQPPCPGKDLRWFAKTKPIALNILNLAK